MNAIETHDFEMIETVRNALTAHYEFPYYALVRIHTRHYGTVHIPAPMFNGMSRRSKWAGNLPIAHDKRDGEYYKCPFCGENSFYSGVCQTCRMDYEVWDEDEEQWIDGELPLEYRNHEALKKAAKDELLRRLDSGLELGILYAEIVLSDGPHDHCETQSPFLKRREYSAEEALNYIDRVIRFHVRHQEREEYEKVIREYVPDGIPIDYIEGDVIEVEGSEELRRHINGVWQHKHPEDGYDYWHPMARVHKESKIYPLCEPDMNDV